MRQLFIDLDGVLADFNAHYHESFGHPLTPEIDRPILVRNLRKHGQFYRTLPVKSDALDLWEGAHRLHPKPIILTGILVNVEGCIEQKRAWIDEHISPSALAIFCKSHEKRFFCDPGDVLIDDWLKYRHLWESAGGVFILHTSADDSLAQAAPFFEVTT